MVPFLAATFLAAIAAAPSGGGHDGSKSARDDVPRPSLQDLLVRLKKERDDHLVQLTASVDQVLRTLDLEIQTKRPAGIGEQRAKLVALGSECAPILVERIDPGDKADEAAKARASTIAQALVEEPSPAITARLVAIARTGTPTGRLNAVKVLATCPDVDQAAGVLSETYKTAEGELRAAALASIARLGGPEADKVLADALESGDTASRRLCLQALAASRAAAYAPKVLKLVAATREAVPCAD
jgi:hypothetical protein